MNNYDKMFGRNDVKEYIICSAIWIKDNCIHKEQPDNIEYGYNIRFYD